MSRATTPASAPRRFEPRSSSNSTQAYASHQFGSFVPQLGDGRAILLGEVVAPDGQRYDIQLKGSGPTPFFCVTDMSVSPALQLAVALLNA